MKEQIEEKVCKNCIHYRMCVDTFRKAKQDGEILFLEEEAYFAKADGCDFYADKRIYCKQNEIEQLKIEIEALKIANEKMYSAIGETKAEVIQDIISLIDSRIRYEVEMYNGFNSARPFKTLCQERVNALNDIKLIINYQFRRMICQDS